MTDSVNTNVSRDDVVFIAKEVAAQVAAQVAATAAQQAAAQVSQQVAQQTAQTVSEAIQKALQTTGMAGMTFEKEIGETGMAERAQVSSADRDALLFANSKRTYDEYQHESLESVRRNRSYVDKILADTASHDGRVRAIAEQALQNAVENANFVGKQAVRHGDVAIDRTWNLDEIVAKVFAEMAVRTQTPASTSAPK